MTVPSQIGISGGFAFLHTHDSSGVIHVESPVIKDYTLGQFFDVWGVLLTKNQIGAYQDNGNDKLWVYVNGKPYTRDLGKLGSYRLIATSAPTGDVVITGLPLNPVHTTVLQLLHPA